MVDVPGRVLEVQRGSDWKVAYLYGFKIDHAALRRAHFAWLSTNIVEVALGAQITSAVASLPPTTWHIWLCGTTSRTASFAHNLALSKRRARAVEAYLEREFGRGGADIQIHTGWVGEVFARARGRREREEIPLDRAVLVAFAMQPYKSPAPPPPPPPIDRDVSIGVPCCALKQEYEYFSLLWDAWNLAETTGSPGKPRLDFSGDPDAISGEPMTGPHFTFKESLESHGWSGERAEWLASNGPMTKARIDGVNAIKNAIQQQMSDLKEQMRHCSSHDPLDLCRDIKGNPFAKFDAGGDSRGSSNLDCDDCDVQIIYAEGGGPDG
jgi:hypothetical protein